MEFRYTEITTWPPLAWLAVCRSQDEFVEVTHGHRVETRPDWFAEAVWDGDYGEGGLDRAELVYGTGGRIRERECMFVSSATTVERLHSLTVDGQTWVSNSLACLLTAVDAVVDPDYSGYFADFETIIRGTQDYQHHLATSAGDVQLTYYNNLLWRNDDLCEVPKVHHPRDFSTFESYREFLETSLCSIADNMRSGGRAFPFDMLSTISSGYDSPTVAAVARPAGLRETLSFASARDGRPDSGAQIARHLGLDPLVRDSNKWRHAALAEVPFLASDAKGEDVYYHDARELLLGRLLLTGYGGSRVWDKGDKLLEHFRRSDQSGLSLCEFRLWAGFVHCPVTYMGGQQTSDLRAISNAPEMQPWDVPGDYTRPICRRILEEVGVPPGLFGSEKKAASILLFDRHSFLSPESLEDYRAWLADNCRRFQPPRHGWDRAQRWTQDTIASAARAAVGRVQRWADATHKVLPLGLLRRIGTSGKLAAFANREPLFDHIFPWAIEKAKQRYARSDDPSQSAETEEELALVGS
jgi:hypothetical protein